MSWPPVETCDPICVRWRDSRPRWDYSRNGFWVDADLPGKHLFFGRPTGGVMPLVWAHAEYLKLVRSAADGQVFDLIPEVATRYRNRRTTPPMEIWKLNRQVRSLAAGGILRIQTASRFRLRWTCDEWQQVHDTESMTISIGPEFADIRVPPEQLAPVRFTFFWMATGHWEGRDFEVRIDR